MKWRAGSRKEREIPSPRCLTARKIKKLVWRFLLIYCRTKGVARNEMEGDSKEKTFNSQTMLLNRKVI